MTVNVTRRKLSQTQEMYLDKESGVKVFRKARGSGLASSSAQQEHKRKNNRKNDESARPDKPSAFAVVTAYDHAA